jgi:hypothetical protein
MEMNIIPNATEPRIVPANTDLSSHKSEADSPGGAKEPVSDMSIAVMLRATS